jgi:hypothetical protein
VADQASTSLTDEDMIEVLEDIIRNGKNAAARIAAIKQLREIREARGSDQPDDGFDALDAGAKDSFGGPRRIKAA